tara:strand:- start:554 stop:670 length:117 start_codon:yes stop_codon:yes gene_type:complete
MTDTVTLPIETYNALTIFVGFCLGLILGSVITLVVKKD